MKRSFMLLWAPVLVLSLLVVPAFADATATDSPQPEAQPAEQTDGDFTEVTFAGMKIAIDKKTGRMRPLNQREAKRLGRQMKRMFKRAARHADHTMPLTTKSASGMQSHVLNPSYLNFEVVQLDEQGELTNQCASSPQGAVELLSTPPSKHAPEER